MTRGTLIVNAKKQVRVKWENAKTDMPVSDAELSASLTRQKIDDVRELNGLEVELEVVGGQPKKVRPVGEPFQKPPQTAAPQYKAKQGQGKKSGFGKPQNAHAQMSQAKMERDFHNPYNFIPAPPRVGNLGELGDKQPAGHDRYVANLWSGKITVRLITETPLLIPDAARMTVVGNDHKTYPVRIGHDGKPYLSPTSIKGMLRAAYEAVTNSRMGVFVAHRDRLAFRMPARDGVRLVPARIALTAGGLQAILLPGTSGISPDGKPDGPMYAAWLPRYDRKDGRVARWAVRLPGGQLPEHGQPVRALLELLRRGGRNPFEYWRVRAIGLAGIPLGLRMEPSSPRGEHSPVASEPMFETDGIVCVTNRNIDRKHDERVFFSVRPANPTMPVSTDLAAAWDELIRNYQDEHRSEIAAMRTGPPALSNSVWSRHVIGGHDETELRDGTLCYALVDEDPAGGGLRIVALYPVMISRSLHATSPSCLLPACLHPAESPKQLSPADRVFGWVKQDGHGAYRGNLRIGPVTCQTTNAADSFGNAGLPLAILGQPKPQQARFYVATTPQGEAQPDGLTKEDAGYRQDKGLRGRKVYPHHTNLPLDYWNDPANDELFRQSNGTHFREYRRHSDAPRVRDDQNRSISGWIKPTTEFTFDVHVTNLSQVELGALIFIITLPNGHFHRLGGGKPLGFGSVRLEINGQLELWDGAGWRQYYGSLDQTALPTFDAEGAVNAFKQGVVTAYGQQTTRNDMDARFRQVPFIAAFLRACAGFTDGLPVHYPRARKDGQGIPVPPHPDGLAYEWFVANDRVVGDQCNSLSLPDLADDKGLPVLEAP